MSQREEFETNVAGSEEVELSISHILEKIDRFTEMVSVSVLLDLQFWFVEFRVMFGIFRRYRSCLSLGKQCSRRSVMNMRSDWLCEFQKKKDGLSLTSDRNVFVFLPDWNLSSGFTRNRWRNGRRRSESCVWSMLRMRRLMLCCIMLDICFRILMLILEGNLTRHVFT